MAQQPVRILIVDDHEMVREGMKAFFAPREELEVIGEACNGLQGVELARELKPDVILLDLLMPEMDGIEATAEILKENPNARILIVTSFSEDERVLAAIRTGALGYLLKDSSPIELEQAILAVFRGESSLHPSIARQIVRFVHRAEENADSKPEELTEREEAVLRYVAEGYSNQQIADQLCLSPWTVRSHVSSILRKLNLDNRTQVALYAIREKYV